MSAQIAKMLPLEFEGQQVRFVGTADKPEWVAADVCRVLGIKNVSQALAVLQPDEKGVCSTYTLGGKQRLATVYESGLYSLVANSRKEEAQRFRRWVFGEVVPSIRKHGVYPPPSTPPVLTLKPYADRVHWTMQVRKHIPAGHWCIFIEGAEILIAAERLFGHAGCEAKQYDLLDGSIGKRWGWFREGKVWAGDAVRYQYTFPDGDPRGTVRPWAYPDAELLNFRRWLHQIYLPTHMPEYIVNKWGTDKLTKALPEFASMGIQFALPPA
ncbi:Bro-N domain-containing protein [Fimbriiglobus ruber]|uniref:Phage antirepressor protein n=1 Tax=Fimbriiglobus ruber TaxID=1908690 RepID=A0A225D408_9BACT|nr:BRO family protein [Fimbriiglobus ruber]OWK34374.1 Phage antirepressor protein [Fimbriiglobus ruber]